MNAKTDKLESLLRRKGKVAVALSGGHDSSILLAFAMSLLGAENCLAVTAATPYMMVDELADSRSFCRELGVAQICLELPLLPEIADNPPDRCYLCKKSLFARIRQEAALRGFVCIADGTNVDDDGDYRPGRRALKELSIWSPLYEAGMGKGDLKELGRMMSLDASLIGKPSYACLMTRLETGREVTEEILRRVDRAETLLRQRGFAACRVRVHGDLARIELGGSDWAVFLSGGVREEIAQEFIRLGFSHVTLDLNGYRRGSMNGVEKSL